MTPLPRGPGFFLGGPGGRCRGRVDEIGGGLMGSGINESNVMRMMNIALCAMTVKLDFVVYGTVNCRCFD